VPPIHRVWTLALIAEQRLLHRQGQWLCRARSDPKCSASRTQQLVEERRWNKTRRGDRAYRLPVTNAPSLIPTPWCNSYLFFKPRRIDIVDSTVGSSICTGWKRRSSAGSLPMVFLYSSANASSAKLKNVEICHTHASWRPQVAALVPKRV
jgi:hypothetical protein